MIEDKVTKYQDEKIGFVIDAKQLQSESGFSVSLSFDGMQPHIPVDMILSTLLEMTTREDLKNRIKAAING